MRRLSASFKNREGREKNSELPTSGSDLGIRGEFGGHNDPGPFGVCSPLNLIYNVFAQVAMTISSLHCYEILY